MQTLSGVGTRQAGNTYHSSWLFRKVAVAVHERRSLGCRLVPLLPTGDRVLLQMQNRPVLVCATCFHVQLCRFLGWCMVLRNRVLDSTRHRYLCCAPAFSLGQRTHTRAVS